MIVEERFSALFWALGYATGRSRSVAAIFFSRGKQKRKRRNKRHEEKCIWNADQTVPEGFATHGHFSSYELSHFLQYGSHFELGFQVFASTTILIHYYYYWINAKPIQGGYSQRLQS